MAKDFIDRAVIISCALSKPAGFGYFQGFLGAALLQKGVNFWMNQTSKGATVHALTSSPGFVQKVAVGVMVCSLAKTALDLLTPKDTYKEKIRFDKTAKQDRASSVRGGLWLTRVFLTPTISTALGVLTAVVVNPNTRSFTIGKYLFWGLTGAGAAGYAAWKFKKENGKLNYSLYVDS